MLTFQPVYQAKENSVFSYLFVPDGQVPENQPWFGIYLRSVQKQNLYERQRLEQFFALTTDRLRYYVIAFVSIEQGASDADVRAFGARLDAYEFERTSRGFACLMWLPSVADVEPATTLVVNSTAIKNPRRGLNTIRAPKKTPFFALSSGESPQALVLAPARGKIRVGANAAGDAVLLSCASGLLVCAGAKSAARLRKLFSADEGGRLEIPISGPQAGCLIGTGTFHPDIQELGPAIRYSFCTPNGMDTGCLDAPLVQDTKVFDDRRVKLSLCPTAPFQPERTSIALAPCAETFPSTFRTRLGGTVGLQPDQFGQSKFVFNQTLGKARYLTPQGPFAIRIDEKEADFLCGLSGIEYVRFRSGDALTFFAGQPAAVEAAITPGQSEPQNMSFARSDQTDATTAWVMIGPGDPESQEKRSYFSEPDQSPFFVVDATSTKHDQLGYMELSRHSLTRLLRTGAPRCFPIVPYAAVSASGQGIADTADFVQAFEAQFLSPRRSEAIKAPGLDHRDPTPMTSGDNVYATTPQGYVARFTDGAWTGIDAVHRMGENTHVSIGFSPAAGEAALSGSLQDAFLTNQQFLVISQATPSLGTFEPVITMDGWTFKLDPGVNRIAGDYKNVIIFKSANASLAQLAANPELWTERAAFNDTETDRDGRFLSRWLMSYIEQARALYDAGRGVETLGQFCSIVDDPNWNGFIALNVSVDIGALSPELEVLLANVDRDQFSAHHIGNLQNHVTPLDDGEFEISSSPFGLIHYVDPVLGSQSDVSYVAAPQPYDFRVLTLEAAFQDAVLTRFSNKSVLVLNELFGDKVASGGSEDHEPINALTLLGSYKRSGSGNTYTFASPAGLQSDLLLESHAIEMVRISRVTMNVVPTDAASSEGYAARFALWGRLSLIEDPAFDLLSYQSIGFQNLAVDLTLSPDPVKAGQFNRHFVFDATEMVLEDNALRLYNPIASNPADGSANLIRKGSLLTQFPLKLKGFVSGTASPLPADQGFRVMETTVPEGISPARISGTSWNAIAFDMNLGSQGAQTGNSPLSALLMLTWPTGGNSQVQIAPYFKLAGPGGLSMSFDIQGVVKFGASDVVLNKVRSTDGSADPNAYVMIFEDIALSVLMLSFPPAGSTNVYLMGGADSTSDAASPTLAWFGGYAVQDSPPPDGGT